MATLSGAVSAGSNPTGGTGQKHNSNTLTILKRLGFSPVTCGDAQPVWIMCPTGPRKAVGNEERCRSEALHANGM
jgi:hypothetical protein